MLDVHNEITLFNYNKFKTKLIKSKLIEYILFEIIDGNFMLVFLNIIGQHFPLLFSSSFP
jgi:hypothetical protein